MERRYEGFERTIPVENALELPEKMECSIGTFCPNSKYGNTERVRKSTHIRMLE